MTIIALEKVTKSFAGVAVLRGADLVINKGEKIGLVGRNGCGKTTLLQIAVGDLEPDSGQRTAAGRPSQGLLEQQDPFNPSETVLAIASRGQREIDGLEKELARLASAMDDAASQPEELKRLIKRHERIEERYRLLGGYASRGRVESVLSGLGFKQEDLDKTPVQLSGGESKRLQLALILLGGGDILFLDEPGNHLDLAGTEWLTGFLRDYRGAVLIVSHDRYLLNGMADRVVELDQGRTCSYRGNYDAYLAEREVRLLTGQRQRAAQDRLTARREEFIRRNFYGQKARQAKSKQKMVDRTERIEVPQEHGPMRFRFREAPVTVDYMVRLTGLEAAYGERVLFQDLSLELTVGEVLGVIGPNGSGKSTLLKMIQGIEKSPADSIWISPSAKWAYFDQPLEGLGRSGSLLEEIRALAPRATDVELRSHLARFLFRGDDVFKDLGDLSGGERSRALLAKTALKEANLLLLDEPTNHLDIYAREALEGALCAFNGTAVIISHDRYLLDGVADKLLVLGEEKPLVHMGNYTDFMKKQKPPPPPGSDRKAGVRKKASRSGGKAGAGDKEGAGSKVKRRHTYEELEVLIIQTEERLKEIEVEIYKEEVYMDAARSEELQAESLKLKRALNDLYEEWETWA